MSVTITIANNRTHHDLMGGYKDTLEDCFACNGGESSTCDICAGKGKIFLREYPFEINLANGNFASLWTGLGLGNEYCGNMDGRRILDALAVRAADIIIRAETRDGNHIHCGVTKEQAERYFNTLALIAKEAERREEQVVWG